MDAGGAADESVVLRTAKPCGLTPRRWCQVGGSHFADDGGKKARSPRRARNKPYNHRAGNAGCSGVPVVTNSCAFYLCTRGRGCSGHPAFPAPSVFSRDMSCKPRAHRVARMRSCVHLGCHCERSEAIHSFFMRRDGLLRFARNDGIGCLKIESARRLRRNGVERCVVAASPYSAPSSSTSSTSSMVISTGLSPRASRPSARPPR
jgi:hypothetical protein